MTKREFTVQCAERCTGVVQMAAKYALSRDGEVAHGSSLFILELLEQDSDEGSRSGTKRVLGQDLYDELQKFKTDKE